MQIHFFFLFSNLDNFRIFATFIFFSRSLLFNLDVRSHRDCQLSKNWYEWMCDFDIKFENDEEMIKKSRRFSRQIDNSSFNKTINQTRINLKKRKREEKRLFFLFTIDFQSTNCWQLTSRREQNDELFSFRRVYFYFVIYLIIEHISIWKQRTIS